MAHTLLLADDSVTIQRVIELTFADEDVRVVTVSDGNQAISALDESAPDIVLADVGMPGRNGYDVAEHVKRTPRLAHIPVVLLTGAFEPVDRSRATAVGCDAILTKPFEPQIVIGRVKELLSRPKPLVPVADDVSRFATQPFDTPRDWAPAAAARGGNQPDEAASEIDSYFDRLDRAFAKLSSSAEPGPASVADTEQSTAAVASASAESVPSFPAALGGASASSTEVSAPTLADAFAALLAAEEQTPGSGGAPLWSVATPVTEELVEQLTQRVLGRFTDAVVRDKVDGIVTAVAERLIREEIERIKASIR